MGRKERRAAEKRERKDQIRMSPQEFYDRQHKIAMRAARAAADKQAEIDSQRQAGKSLDMLILFGMEYLNRSKGYGRKRLEDYYDGVMKLLEEYGEDKITLHGIAAGLEERTGIQLREG